MKIPELNNLQIAVVGLGYVVSPLAVEFGKKFPTIGFDINESTVYPVATEEVADLVDRLYKNIIRQTTLKLLKQRR